MKKSISVTVVAIIILLLIVILFTLNRPTDHTESTAVLSRVRQLSSALELYHNDKNSYPDELQQLVPSYIDDEFTRTYDNKKNCLSNQPIISYKTLSKNEYSLKFCLADPTGTYDAGSHELTQLGIQ